MLAILSHALISPHSWIKCPISGRKLPWGYPLNSKGAMLIYGLVIRSQGPCRFQESSIMLQGLPEMKNRANESHHRLVR